MHLAKDIARAAHAVGRAFDDDLVAARANIHAQPVFDLHQIGVKFAEQPAKAGLIIEGDFDARARFTVICRVSDCGGVAAGCAGCFAGHRFLS